MKIREYNLHNLEDYQRMVNHLIDALGVDGLTSEILVACEARENAYLIGKEKKMAQKFSRINQIYRDAKERIKIIK